MSGSGRLVTQPSLRQAETAEELLQTGLLNLWYLIAASSDVMDRPVGLKRLGRNLVLWRDNEGTLNIVEDYCPHRGAPLSLGEVVDGRISCAYHGFQLTGAGVVAAVPPMPECPLIGKKMVKSYPCREYAGAIWAYFSDDDNAEVPEPIFPEEIVSDEWSSFLFTAQWNCNWQLTLDNRTDPVHGSFLHAGTFTLGYGRKDAHLDIVPTQNGFHTERDNQKGVNIDWHEVNFYPGNSLWVRTEIPYPPSFGGGSFRILGHPTPIDENSTYVWFYRARKISGWQRDMWRFLYKNRLEARAFNVVEQDRILLESMSLESRKRQALIQTDVAVARMRKIVLEEAKKQIEARKERRG